MLQGVPVTVSWIIKPDLADAFVEALTDMFPATQCTKAFETFASSEM